MDLAPRLSPQDLTSLTAPSNSENDNLQRLKRGRDAAKMILSRYPDYGKASPEYLASIAELLSDMPPENLRVMTDKFIGISARCKFLPTHADLVEFDEGIEAKRYATRDLRQGRVPEPVYSAKPAPFPKLWAAFYEEPHLMERSFDCLCDASKALGMHGREAALDILKRGRSAA